MTSLLEERDNSQWLSDLRGDHDRREQAVADLREFLHRALTRSLKSKGVSANQVEDFVHEAILKILDRLEDFQGQSQFTTWAMTISIRVAFTEMRRARWRDHSLDELLGGEEGGEVTGSFFSTPAESEENLHRRQIRVAMEGVLSQLAERQRSLLRAELDGVPKSVLAERLGTNTNALYKATHDARRRLRQGLLATGLSETEIRAAFSA